MVIVAAVAGGICDAASGGKCAAKRFDKYYIQYINLI